MQSKLRRHILPPLLQLTITEPFKALGGPSAINVAFTCSAGSAMSSSVRFAGKGPDSIVSKRHKSLHGDPV